MKWRAWVQMNIWVLIVRRGFAAWPFRYWLSLAGILRKPAVGIPDIRWKMCECRFQDSERVMEGLTDELISENFSAPWWCGMSDRSRLVRAGKFFVCGATMKKPWFGGGRDDLLHWDRDEYRRGISTFDEEDLKLYRRMPRDPSSSQRPFRLHSVSLPRRNSACDYRFDDRFETRQGNNQSGGVVCSQKQTKFITIKSQRDHVSRTKMGASPG